MEKMAAWRALLQIPMVGRAAKKAAETVETRPIWGAAVLKAVMRRFMEAVVAADRFGRFFRIQKGSAAADIRV